MAKKQKTFRPKPRVPRGFQDERGGSVRAKAAMLDRIRAVYELYGFEPLETSAIEYSDALGKFLPDDDRPNMGVFSFQDDDEQWVSLRYDLTAPLARFVAENYDGLPKPFRRYQTGAVWRNEKPGPGRFRQFTQFDADTVGSPLMASDAEMCLLLADTMEALGLARGDYLVRVNNRKILDGVLEKIDLSSDDPGFDKTRLTVLRAIDKLDRLGLEGVELLLGEGRKDESGDYTEGAKLSAEARAPVLSFLEVSGAGRGDLLRNLEQVVAGSAVGEAGVAELMEIEQFVSAGGYGEDRIVIDPGIVRGLEYYTGPVYESELLFETLNEKGEPVRFGSVGSGGRYDGLVARFRGQPVPATGCSVGVSRLFAALQSRGRLEAGSGAGPVVVLIMDYERLGEHQKMVQELRAAGLAAELYLGGSGMKAQLKYADKRAAPIAVIQGEDERAAGQVTLKDLELGARMSQSIEDNKAWREGQPAQLAVDRGALVEQVRAMLARQAGDAE